MFIAVDSGWFGVELWGGGPCQFFMGPLKRMDISVTDLSGVGSVWVDQVPQADAIVEPAVLILVEPRATRPELYVYAEKEGHRFSRILTFDATLLSKYRHARLFPFGTTWVPATRWAAAKPSEAGRCAVSFLCGEKLSTLGHKLRRAAYAGQARYTLNNTTGGHLVIFRSGQGSPLPPISDPPNPIFKGGKEDLHLPFRFSLVIENSVEPNYFSEKLVDCLLCRTVPIYWGCSNIDEFFNPAGIIRIRATEKGEFLKELEGALRQATVATYEAVAAAIEDNLERARQWARPYKERVIEELGGAVALSEKEVAVIPTKFKLRWGAKQF
jgi:hypothetical protein